MAKQQTKRRRKRYEPGSAYAGDVRPTGVLGFLGSARTIRVVFVLMALALGAGGFAAIFRGGALTGGSSSTNPAGFVLPTEEESDGTPAPGATIEVRQYVAPPEMTIDPSKRYLATIKTEVGDIQVELFADQAPQLVNNFVFLARDGFYDGLIFHYAAPEFEVIAGDPACKVGASGSVCRGDGGPGYELQEEAPGDIGKGTLGMVNGSQFFISLTESEQFEGFSPFGRIISGLDVAEQVTEGTAIKTIEIAEQ